MRSILTLLSFLLVVFVLISCDDSLFSGFEDAGDTPMTQGAASKGGTTVILSDGMPVTIASFNPFQGELPEGIAVDRFGSIYVSMTPLGEIWKLRPNGSFEEIFASFDLDEGDLGVTGLRFGPRGNLFAGVASAAETVNGVWKIAPGGGSMERLPGTSGISFPNDVDVSPNGTVYISDSPAGAVWRYTPDTEAEVWIQHESLEGTGAFGLGFPIGANGLVFASGNQMPFAGASGATRGGVLVANSEKGQLVYVPVKPNGDAGEPAIVISDPDELFGIDGIILDALGTIYGAVNVANRIVRVNHHGTEIEEVAAGEPLDFPASLTFGAGRDRHTLFIANFAFIHLTLDPPEPENANPSVTKLQVGPPGR